MYVRKLRQDERFTAEDVYSTIDQIMATHNYRLTSEKYKRLYLAKRQWLRRYAELKGTPDGYEYNAEGDDLEASDRDVVRKIQESKKRKSKSNNSDLNAVRLEPGNDGYVGDRTTQWCYKIAARLSQNNYDDLTPLERFEMLRFLCDEALALSEVQSTIENREERLKHFSRRLAFRGAKQRSINVNKAAGKKVFEYIRDRRQEAAKLEADKKAKEEAEKAKVATEGAMVAASETGAAKIEPAISKSENDVTAIETPMKIDTVEKKTEVSKAEVAVAPGIGFGEYGEGYVRIGLVENEHRIRQAAKNVKKLISG